MQKKINKFIIFILFISINFEILANISIIRDSEIEETLNNIAAPLAKSSGIADLKIYLINDPQLNAFTPGGNIIYLNSGVITKFAEIDVVRGIIAHEIGHIVSGHVMRQIENINIDNKFTISTIAIGLAIVLINPNSDSLGKGLSSLSILTPHILERSYLKYSRTFESCADHAAIKLLHQNNFSLKGMIEFFEYTKRGENRELINPYEQTHPMSHERLIALKKAYIPIDNTSIDKELNYKYARIRGKLIGFTTDLKKLKNFDYKKFDPEIEYYIKAVSSLRLGSLDNANLYLAKLFDLKPNDPFYNELKGQILFEFGKNESLKYYDIVYKLRPSDDSIKLSRAIVGITIYQNCPSKMKEYYEDLKLIANKEKSNILALYYIAIYYEKTRQKGKALLNLAKIAVINNNLHQAAILAKASLKELPVNTPEWYGANDIIMSQ